MIKIYKNFFDSDCLEYIDASIEKSKNTANLRTSYPSNGWDFNIIHQSTPVMVYDMHDANILEEQLKIKLKEDVDFNMKLRFMIYYWPMGSYIPWHNDDHVTLTATLYCNRFWDRNWGGLFLYEENDKILAEVPEWNKLVIQTNDDWHSTTSVTIPYYLPVVRGGSLNAVPTIRTTIQIFMLEEYEEGGGVHDGNGLSEEKQEDETTTTR